MSKVAIIGTGMTALSIAYHLPKRFPHVEITFFDKSRKPGGRLSTRRTRQDKSIVFDHGAPFLSKDNLCPQLRELLLSELKCIEATSFSMLSESSPGKSIEYEAYSSPNGLQSISETLIKHKIPSQAYYDTRIESITRNKNQNTFSVKEENSVSEKISALQFDRVFCCIPFPQTQMLKQTEISLEQVKMSYVPSWIVMLSIDSQKMHDICGSECDVIEFKKGGNIAWAVRQNKKFRHVTESKCENWAFYMSDDWSQKNKDLSKEEFQKNFGQVLSESSELFKKEKLSFNHIVTHRWLYSKPKQSNVSGFLYSKDQKIIFAGDWVGGLKNVGQCWDLGAKIVQKMQGVNSKL